MQPLDYLQSTTGIIWLAVCAVMGFVFTYIGYTVINMAPAKWFCDYNEEPTGDLLTNRRVSYKKSGIVLSVIMAVSFMLCRLQFNKGYDIYFIVCSLIIFTALMVTISDFKYTIIPDQFTVALGVFSLAISVYDLARGYNILHQSWWSPIVGALIGGAVMLLIDFLGMLIYKQDGMGFGDVKLFFAVGILTGFPGTIYSLIISIIVAAICFTVILIAVKIMVSAQKSPEEDSAPSSTFITLNSAEESSEAAADESRPPELSENSPNTDENIGEAITTGNADESQSAERSENDGEPKSDEGKASGNPEDDAEDDEKITGKSRLAFGPYIAITVIAYTALFDFIYYLADLYLELF